MGEYADMMLDGTLCQSCGEYLGDGDGFPVTCSGCSGSDFESSGKTKKLRNLEWSTNHLIEQNIKFTSHNKGVHLKVYRPAGIIDFWPSTGKYKRIDGTYGRGIKNMLKETNEVPSL